MTVLFAVLDRSLVDLIAAIRGPNTDLDRPDRVHRVAFAAAQVVLPALAAILILGLPEFQLLLNLVGAIAGFLLPAMICISYLKLIDTSRVFRNCTIAIIAVLLTMMVAEIASTVLLRAGVI